MPYCNHLIKSHWAIHKEASCVEIDFQNFSGGACHQNNRFDQSDSSSATHAQKPKSLYPIYSLAIADHHMSGRPSYVTLKCKKHSIAVLRYMFGSVYMNTFLINRKILSEFTCIGRWKVRVEYSVYKTMVSCYIQATES